MSELTAMPTLVAARLVAGHVNLLWQQWANDEEHPGCCPTCCGPCSALYDLRELGLLDELYGAYADHVGGEMETWDPVARQVRRAWLDEAWGVDLGCCEAER